MSRSYRMLAVLMLVFVAFGSLMAVAGCSDDATSATDEPAAQTAETPTTDTTQESVSGEEVLAGACSQCHDAARVFVQPYAVDWSAMIDEMRDAHGATLTDEEEAAIIEFLGSRELSEGEKVVAGKCGECHDATRIYEQGESADWAEIVRQMAEIHGAELTDAEKAAAVEFLSGL